jgi:DNA-binding SARP family transcriptional activator/Tfp pilus assembly protein PilF
MAEVEFGLLGPLLVRGRGQALPIPPGKQRALLAVLLLHGGRLVSMDEVYAVLWGSSPPPSARVTVHNHVKRLRQALAGAGLSRIGTGPDGYRIEVGPDELDVLRFEAATGRAAGAARRGDWDRAAADLHAALALWRGEPLADVPSELLAAREAPRLAEMRLRALEARIDADLHLGRHAAAIPELRQLCAAHPLRDRLHGLLMLALYRDGRAGEALACYQRVRRTLTEELGNGPGPDLRQTEQQIRARDPALAWPAPGTPRPGGSAPASTPAAGDAARDAAWDAAEDAEEDAAAQRRQAGASQAARSRAAAVPRQLLAPVRHFAGRAAELRTLTEVLDLAAGPSPEAVVISAIGGTAGVGKTALALHWAHQVADRFPDGQLYANLHGFDPSGLPAGPGTVIRGFLDALGVPAHQVPGSDEDRLNLYRRLVADGRVLVVLDNARDAEQVRPLLPGGAACLALVTSRSQLGSLVAVEGAHLVTLDVLSPAEARELLTRRLGPERVAAEPEVAADLAELCARLPLAVAIAAARAAMYPDLPLATLAAELRDAAGRLDALDTGEAEDSVRAVLSWSYRHLGAPAARMLRLLGVHPGPDISAAAAASLAGISLAEAREALSQLSRANLVSQPVPGRFTFHDLLRAYAAERARAEDSGTERSAATVRTLDHYLHTAYAATRRLYTHHEDLGLAPPQAGVTPEVITDHDQGAAWFTAEHRVLLAAVNQAVSEGLDVHAWQLPTALTTFLDRSGSWADVVTTNQVALAAARRAGNRRGQARAHRNLAHGHTRLGCFAEAEAEYGYASDLYRELGDQGSQGRVHSGLAFVFDQQEKYREALGHTQRALSLYQAVGEQAEVAMSLGNIGWCYAKLEDYQQCLVHCHQSAAMYSGLGNESETASNWHNIGYAHLRLGDTAQAISYFRRALEVIARFGDSFGQTMTLIDLGDAYQAGGQPELARDAWQQALASAEELQLPAAEEIRARLDQAACLGGHPPDPRTGSAGERDAEQVDVQRDDHHGDAGRDRGGQPAVDQRAHDVGPAGQGHQRDQRERDAEGQHDLRDDQAGRGGQAEPEHDQRGQHRQAAPEPQRDPPADEALHDDLPGVGAHAG